MSLENAWIMAHHPDEGDIFIIQQLARWTPFIFGYSHTKLLMITRLGFLLFRSRNGPRFRTIRRRIICRVASQCFICAEGPKQSEDEQVKKRIEHWAVSVEQVIKETSCKSHSTLLGIP